MVVDAASSFVKSKIAGAGRKRGPGRPKSKTAKPKKAPAKWVDLAEEALNLQDTEVKNNYYYNII